MLVVVGFVGSWAVRGCGGFQREVELAIRDEVEDARKRASRIDHVV